MNLVQRRDDFSSDDGMTNIDDDMMSDDMMDSASFAVGNHTFLPLQQRNRVTAGTFLVKKRSIFGILCHDKDDLFKSPLLPDNFYITFFQMIIYRGGS